MADFFTCLGTLKRGGNTELALYGELVVSEGSAIRYRTGVGVGSYPARSLLKPFQFLATHTPLEQWEGKPSVFLSALGSVSATEEQVRSLEEKYGAHYKRWEPAILFKAGFPQDPSFRHRLKEEKSSGRKIYHSCFSKHGAILEACERFGWDKSHYCSTEHPFHLQLCETLDTILETKRSYQTATDGCGLPTPILSLGELARLYQKLASASDSSALGHIRALMLKSPQWIGGPGRLDTELMKKNEGKIVAKEGADGLWAIGMLPTKAYPEGLGIILKLAEGYQPAHAGIVLVPLLEKLGLKPEYQLPPGQTWESHYEPFQSKAPKLWDISPSVSNQTAVFPGDVPFQRKVSLDTAKGDHLTLSSCLTTLHVGAHVDAPNHFKKGAEGICSVLLDRYVGPCQVIEVRKGVKALVDKSDLMSDVEGERILIKTRSFPNPNHFNEDFLALSPLLIEYLGEKGVKLVGVDTPSLDPVNSKTLLAHHATLKYKLAILEGIVLEEVPPGFYDLSALPLRLADADASPVRAVLRSL